MPSVALHTWQTQAARALDEIADAHSAVGGRGRGRRHATREINHAYAVLLSSQFQRFCRDLHSEAVSFIVDTLAPSVFAELVLAAFREGRRLDRGNPNPGNLGADFGRLGIAFWPELERRSARSRARRRELESFAVWRNAIAHQDFVSSALQPPAPLRLATVRRWRSICSASAREFDEMIGDHLAAMAGLRPW
jgi:hypothetical protein